MGVPTLQAVSLAFVHLDSNSEAMAEHVKMLMNAGMVNIDAVIPVVILRGPTIAYVLLD